MKSKVIQMVFPVIAFLFAIASAFAFNFRNDSMVTLYSGHKKVGVMCVDTGIMCTDVNTQVICKDATGATLYKHGPTSCFEQLWKPLP